MCALALAVTCGLASAVSSTVSSGKISAHLTKKSFTSSQASSVKLVCKFSKTSGSFSYLLTFKKGSKWQAVRSVKKKGTFNGSKSMTVKAVFAGKSVKVGSYWLKLFADGGSKLLSFKVVKGSTSGGSTGGGGSIGEDPTPAGNDPVNTALPIISGTTVAGQKLTVSNGSWDNAPSSYAYHWQRCEIKPENLYLCADISNATASSYLLQTADVSRAIRARVTAENYFGLTSAVSDPTGAITSLYPTNLSPPGISIEGGSLILREGVTLQIWRGNWTNDPTSYRYQWLRCGPTGDGCSEVPAADPEFPEHYTVTASDVGFTMRVSVTASNAFGSSSATSDPPTVIVERA